MKLHYSMTEFHDLFPHEEVPMPFHSVVVMVLVSCFSKE